MAKFRKILLGGMIGAGLALLLSRKEVRRRLMGGYRQLPAAGPETGGAPAAREDLEARIEETRREVETRLEEPFVPAAAVEELEEVEEAEPAPALIEEVAVEEAIEAPGPEAEAVAAETGPEAEAEAPAAEPEAKAAPVEPEAEMPIEEEAELATEMLVEEEAGPLAETAFEKAAAPEAAVEPIAETPAAAEAAEEQAAQTEAEAEAAEVELEAESEISALATPAEGEPSIEEPAAPAAAEPSVRPEPAGLDREEMKKRIDETRARLKAKAFDAMVSGETFVTPETGEPIKAEEPEVEIDRETGEQIDRSLKEQD